MTKSASQLVDEFTENLVEGNIESHLLESTEISKIQPIKLGEALDKLESALGNYRLEKDSEKREKLAEIALSRILVVRNVGLMKNNPNTAKHVAQERDFYRNQVSILEKQLEERDKSIDGYVKTIMTLKAGGRGVG